MHDGNRSNFRDRCHIVFCQFSFDHHLGNVEMTKEITKGSIADIMQNSNVSLAESFLSCDCVVLFDVSGSMNTGLAGSLLLLALLTVAVCAAGTKSRKTGE